MNATEATEVTAVDDEAAREANQQLLLAGLRQHERADQADAARNRAAFLAEASRRLTETFDAEAALRNVAALAVPVVADLCFIDMVGGGSDLRRVAWAHSGELLGTLRDQMQRFAPPRDRLGDPVAQALATLAPVLVSRVCNAWLETIATSPEHLDFLQALNLRSVMTVPLAIGERPLGAITFCFTAARDREYAPDDQTLAQELAGRVALAVENARLYGELQLALRVRDDFLASTAHDLRTPLSAIKGYAYILRRQLTREAAAGAGGTTPTTSTPAPAAPTTPSAPGDPPLPALQVPPPATDALMEIDAAVGRMTRLIGALQDTARHQAGYLLHLDRRPTDVVAIARRVAAEHNRLTSRHAIRVETDAPALTGSWDPDRLERALDNLVGNAVKYSPGGGEIVVSLAQEGVEAVLSVRDEGLGIPAADQLRLFERFHRGANVIGQIDGAGIGLSDVYRVVTEHGGTVSVESREQDAQGRGGSTFTVRLPQIAVCSPPAQ